MPARTWNNASGGNWRTKANWKENKLPDDNDNVTISLTGTYSVTVDGASIKVGALLLNSANVTLAIGANTLAIAAKGSNPGTATLTAGHVTLAGGTFNSTNGISVAAAANIIGNGTISGAGVLSGTGIIQASGGTLTISSVVGAGTTGLQVGSGATDNLVLGNTVGLGSLVSFQSSTVGTLTISNVATFNGSIANLAVSGSITALNKVVLTGVTGVDHASLAGTTITLFNASNAALATLTLNSAPVGTAFVHHTQSGGSTTIFLSSVTCFLRGTRIETPTGEVAVEDLSIGDAVVTASGDARVIKWIGRRGYVPRLMAPSARHNVLPIRFARGSLGNNLPKRDLFVSPEHAMCLGNVLIPAQHLVNGTSIAYCDSFATIEYFHLELPSHDVIRAEGAAVESWLDCGNRNLFSNVLEYLALNLPDEDVRPQPCLPFITEGPKLAAIRQELAAHVGSVGFGLTTDPDLRLVTDGATVQGTCGENHVYSFNLPSVPNRLALVSRTSVPADINPESRDRRSLGVRLTKIVLKSGGLTIEVRHDDPSLCDGFHQAEPRHRWTDGNATIPEQFLACLTGPTTVEVHLGGLGLTYATRAGSEGEVIPLERHRVEVMTAMAA
ncbi:MAG: Hint domain-containing protein [Candidatus Binatia bacterium]